MRRRLTRAMQLGGKQTVNRLILACLQRGIPLPTVNPKTMIAVASPGRKSGIRRETPLGFVRVDDAHLWVVAEHGERSDWYRNAKAAGRFEVLLDRRWRPATVKLLPDEDPAAVVRRYASKAVAAANKALQFDPKVAELTLLPE